MGNGGKNLTRRSRLKVMANVGKGRYMCEVIKQNPLTTVVKIDPVSLINELRLYFMENGISMRTYREMLREYGITRKGISKRHNLKHAVTRCY
jgi:hypothetical protein